MAYNPYFQQCQYGNGYPMPQMQGYPAQANGAAPDLMAQYKAPYQMTTAQMPAAPMQQTPVPVPQTQQMQAANDIVWVQGEAGAKSYPVAPNTRLLLMDSEADVFYIKSVDGSGMPLPLRTFDYVERTSDKPREKQQEHVCQCTGKYVSRDDFEALAAELEEMRKRIDAMTTAQ